MKKVAFWRNINHNFLKLALISGALLGTSAFADDSNLTEALPDTMVDPGVWKAAGLVVAAVVAVKGIQIAMRLLKRV